VSNQVEAQDSLSAATAGAQTASVTPEVSGLLLRALADVAMRCGIAPAALFQGETRQFTTCDPVEVRVPLPVYRELLTRAIALTGDPALGLRCGLYASESAFDLLAPLVAHVPTLRHAIQETRQFQALAFDGAYVHLTERAGVARVRCEFPRSHDATDRSLAEFLTAGCMRMLRGFGCTREDFYAARFEHGCPVGYQHVYAEAFERKERFSQPFTGLEFSASLLDRPHLHANPTLQSLVHAQAEQRLGRLARPTDLIDRLRLYLRSQLAAVPDMAVAARELGVSSRTLRRRLAEARQSYRALTQELQGERACTMLRNPDFTVQGVANALGFANTAAFHRAFRRWTGLTACEYRHERMRPPVALSAMADTHALAAAGRRAG
jgi:AraC-like DNA-binding protein